MPLTNGNGAGMDKPKDELKLLHLRPINPVEYGGYWGEHPKHTVGEWKEEVQANETRLGYWDWVNTRADITA